MRPESRIKSLIQIIRLLISPNKKKKSAAAATGNRAIYASASRVAAEGNHVISSKPRRSIIHPLISFNYLISSQFAANVWIDISIYGPRESEGEGIK